MGIPSSSSARKEAVGFDDGAADSTRCVEPEQGGPRCGLASERCAGRSQALALAEELADCGITRVISSPYVRALDTVRPLAERLGIPVEICSDLRERKLGCGWLDDWRELLEKAWADFSFALPHCESSNACQQRVRACVEELCGRYPGETIALSSHGNAIALLLNSMDPSFGFERWEAMKNPEVFRIDWSDGLLRWHASSSTDETQV